jgi:hypothetical protein
MVIVAGVCFGKGIPEQIELLLCHVENILHLFHGRINIADHIQVADVKHRVSVTESVQVYPEGLVIGQNQVSHIEVTVTAGPYVLNGMGKIFEYLAIPAAYELYLVQSSHELLLTAGEEISVALGAEQNLTVTAHQLRHLFYALRIVVTDTGERSLVFYTLRYGCV